MSYASDVTEEAIEQRARAEKAEARVTELEKAALALVNEVAAIDHGGTVECARAYYALKAVLDAARQPRSVGKEQKKNESVSNAGRDVETGATAEETLVVDTSGNHHRTSLAPIPATGPDRERSREHRVNRPSEVISDGVHGELNTCGRCGGTGQAPAIRGNRFVVGETMVCPACMHREGPRANEGIAEAPKKLVGATVTEVEEQLSRWEDGSRIGVLHRGHVYSVTGVVEDESGEWALIETGEETLASIDETCPCDHKFSSHDTCDCPSCRPENRPNEAPPPPDLSDIRPNGVVRSTNVSEWQCIYCGVRHVGFPSVPGKCTKRTGTAVNHCFGPIVFDDEPRTTMVSIDEVCAALGWSRVPVVDALQEIRLNAEALRAQALRTDNAKCTHTGNVSAVDLGDYGPAYWCEDCGALDDSGQANAMWREPKVAGKRVDYANTREKNLAQALGSLGYGDRIEEWAKEPPSWAGGNRPEVKP